MLVLNLGQVNPWLPLTRELDFAKQKTEGEREPIDFAEPLYSSSHIMNLVFKHRDNDTKIVRGSLIPSLWKRQAFPKRHPSRQERARKVTLPFEYTHPQKFCL